MISARVSVYVFLLLLLSWAAGNVDAALEFYWREHSNDPDLVVSLKPLWKHVFNSLLESIEDYEFRTSVREKIANGMHEKGSDKIISYCDLSFVTCDFTDIVALTLVGMENGKVNFNRLPNTLQKLIVSRSILDQMMNVSGLPPVLESIEFDHVQFENGDAEVSSSLANLKEFKCTYCGIKSLTFQAVEGIQNMILDGTMLTDLPSNLPQSLETLSMRGCSITAPLREIMARLPPNLHSIDISNTGITGMVNGLRLMPRQLKKLIIDGNSINDSIESLSDAFEHHGGSLERFSASGCKLRGTLKGLENMKTLKSLDLSNNQIEMVVWKELPSNLDFLNLSHNTLTGEVPLTEITRALKELNISHNKLSGNFWIPGLPPEIQTIDISYNQFTGDVSLEKLPESIRFVYIQHNMFQGTPNLVELPVQLRHILIHNNNWDSLLPAL
ncbi:putative leucine-rich repeat protein [Trypanosoma theileri]|uniref:Putative leucine-rich repeat protein n=1 Tax=Trypanosoma theileri TaxID=67003 RepID=A0A1X0P012_9TRYP|nr:putative leucine-rich repeat protein [Trypanosoma theileri]ORC90284.1 putative leucine-rich repeat protein [Trypanosoma theileri]